nr:hypothetical protein [Streptomyces spinoverrucosus]
MSGLVENDLHADFAAPLIGLRAKVRLAQDAEGGTVEHRVHESEGVRRPIARPVLSGVLQTIQFVDHGDGKQQTDSFRASYVNYFVQVCVGRPDGRLDVEAGVSDHKALLAVSPRYLLFQGFICRLEGLETLSGFWLDWTVHEAFLRAAGQCSAAAGEGLVAASENQAVNVGVADLAAEAASRDGCPV